MRSVKKIGYAVVGLGAIAKGAVLPAFAHTRHAQLVAVVSRDKKKAMRIGNQFKARPYGSDEYQQCLRDPDVSAVYIATPPGEHAKYAVAAARAGKHVLCEKPLAATVQQSRRIVQAHQQNGTLLMTAYRKYFEPACLYMKSLISNGDLGRIDVIHTVFSELYLSGSPAWLLDPKLAGGGPLMDLGIYCVNTSRWLIDEDPVRVSAWAWRCDPRKFRRVEEGIQFRLEFPSGTMMQASTTYSAVLSSFMWVQGTKGWLLLAPAFPFDEDRRLTGRVAGRRIDKRFKVTDEFAAELDAFASAILNGKSLQPDGAQGHRDMLIMKAIYRAARRSKSIVIRYD